MEPRLKRVSSFEHQCSWVRDATVTSQLLSTCYSNANYSFLIFQRSTVVVLRLCHHVHIIPTTRCILAGPRCEHHAQQHRHSGLPRALSRKRRKQAASGSRQQSSCPPEKTPHKVGFSYHFLFVLHLVVVRGRVMDCAREPAIARKPLHTHNAY